jgi:hypothetical protein
VDKAAVTSPARQGLDRLLARYPDRDVELIDWQAERPDRELPTGAILLGRIEGPWVCVDLTGGERFAI